ncbi:MAG: ATP-binding protein [Bacteroidota bacterium]
MLHRLSLLIFFCFFGAETLFAFRVEAVDDIQPDTIGCQFFGAYLEELFERGNLREGKAEEIAQHFWAAPQLRACKAYPFFLNWWGFLQYSKGDIMSARTLLLEANEILFNQSAESSAHYIRNLIFLGLTYNLQHDYSHAILYFDRAREASMMKKDTGFTIDVLSNLGLAHLENGDFQLAQKYLLDARFLTDSLKNQMHQGYINQNLARVYLKLEDYTQALTYADQAERTWAQLGDTSGLYYAAQIKAEIFGEQKEQNQVLECYQKALTYSKNGVIDHLNGEIHSKIAAVYRGFGQADLAALHYREALKHGEGLPYQAVEVAQDFLARHYQKTGNVQGLTEMQDLLIHIGKTKAELQAFDNQKRLENEIALEKERSKSKRLAISRAFDQEKLQITRRFNIFLLLATLVSLLFGGTIFSLYKSNKKLLKSLGSHHVELEKFHAELSHSAAVISEQNSLLANQNKELERFAYILSHDLKQPAGTVVNFSRLIMEQRDTLSHEELERMLGFVSRAGESIHRQVGDLLALAQWENPRLAPGDLQAEKVLEELLQDLAPTIKATGACIQLPSGPIPLRADPIKLKLVFQNLFTNALKFVKEGEQPKVQVTYHQDDDFHYFSVRDQGIGIPPEHHHRIFSMFQKIHPKTEFDGTGVGLAICEKLVRLHGGTIVLHSQENQGSKFTFSIAKEV